VPIPEPSTIALVGSSVTVLGCWTVRRAKRKRSL
jgi:hypothetical protein